MIGKRRNIGAALLLLGSGLLWGQAGERPAERFVLAFYNVENLFDTVNDPGKADGEFTPCGSYGWNAERYRHKVTNIARVLAQVGGGPDVIGLAEVENAGVLEDLIRESALAKKGYDYVYFESGDARGIGTACLYRPLRFRLLGGEPLEYRRIFGASRHILHVWGLSSGEKVHILICHLPSVPSPFRERAEAVASLKHYADSLQRSDPDAGQIVMRDFNANPDDGLLKPLFGGREPGGLENPFREMYRTGRGSYLYRGRWNLYDAILADSAFFRGGAGLKFGKAGIFIRDFLMQQEGVYRGYPLRTFGGRRYLGGYSDHLPVYMVLEKNVPR